MKNKIKLPFSVRIVCLMLWIVVLTYFLFFTEAFGRDGTIKTFSYNFIPFKEILRFLTKTSYFGPKIVLINVIGNILLFMPFGFFFASILKYPVKHAAWKVTFVSTFLSGFMEFIQFMTKTGCCDIDDIILNTFGGYLGYVLFAALFLRKIDMGQIADIRNEKIVELKTYKDAAGQEANNQ